MLKVVVYKVTTVTHRVYDYALSRHILYIVLFSTPHTTSGNVYKHLYLRLVPNRFAGHSGHEGFIHRVP